MTKTTSTLLREHLEIRQCLEACETQLATMSLDHERPAGLFAMEIAAWKRHRERLDAIEYALERLGVVAREYVH